MRSSSAFALLLVIVGCSGADLATTPSPAPVSGAPRDGGAASDVDAEAPQGDAEANPDAPAGGTRHLRIMAANISSGDTQGYDSGEGIRIFQGLHPDIALVQETNYKTNTESDIREFVTTAFGATYTYYRESDVQIPNAVVSRYPIVTSGRWVDPEVSNRGFAYAKIAIPGSHPLWAVSVHLLTTSSASRNSEATALVEQLGGVVADGDYVVIGGDFNTNSRTETCITKFGQILETKGPYPADQDGNDFTNAPRNKPYDWLLASKALAAHQVATVIGKNDFAAGLVFDSRVYTPLTDVAPVLSGDSDAQNMQHMPVVKDFDLPE